MLHSFGAGSDGRNPDAALKGHKGLLYGTTSGGGAYSCGPYVGCGTVFTITPSGHEKVLHSFGNGADGANPHASLIELAGKLYGTTTNGGAYKCSYGYSGGCGTVFSITPGGKEAVLHSFGGASDGYFPNASLIGAYGTFYGTTQYGGKHGYGTLFAFIP